MNLSSKTVALYMGLIFASGAVVGVLGDRLYNSNQQVAEQATQNADTKEGKGRGRRPSPEEFRRGYLSFMQRRLELSDEQVSDLNLVLDDTQNRMDLLMRGTVPQQRSIWEEQNQKIRALLSNTQLTEYEQMIAEREDRDRDRNRGGKNRREDQQDQ